MISKISKILGILVVFSLIFYYFFIYKKVDVLEIPFPEASIISNTSKKYLSSNLCPGCQLGNNIFEFAALYGLSKRLNRTPTFFIKSGYHERMLGRMRNVMPVLVEKFLAINGSVPDSIKRTRFHDKCCTFEDPEILEDVEDEYLHLTGVLYQSWKYFPDMKDTLVDFLKNPKSQNFGNRPISDDSNHVTCVHTRRGDFLEYGFYGSDPTFIRNALEFINAENNTHKARSTVIFGDDLKFMTSIFDDSGNANIFISMNSPSDDLLYSKFHCDVVLISAPRSTFGFWMGYFSRGDTVYYFDIKYANDEQYQIGNFTANDYYLPHWTPLKFASFDNFTVIERTKQ